MVRGRPPALSSLTSFPPSSPCPLRLSSLPRSYLPPSHPLTTHFQVPDDPSTTRVWWFTAEEQDLARERVERMNKVAPTVLSRKLVKTIFSRWVLYVFALAYA